MTAASLFLPTIFTKTKDNIKKKIMKIIPTVPSLLAISLYIVRLF